MRKVLCALLVLALMFNFAACSSQSGTYTPGSYSATAKGFGGDVTVTITVDADSITDVTITGDKETPAVGGAAMESLPEAILAAQSEDIETVTGATYTSDAVKEALGKAIALAKGGEASTEPIAFTAGTYTGTGAGYNGDVVLTVTFTDDMITGIEIVDEMETEHVGTSAYDIIFQDIMDFTSTGVDTVSGATFTSNAVLTAVEDAATQAGCNIDSIRAGALAYELTPGDKIEETYDVVVIGAGGAGMSAAAAAAQEGATVLVLEKDVEMGGNTLVSGGAFQVVQPDLVWDPSDPEATTAVYSSTGETVTKVKSDLGRLATLQTILDWSEEPFDEGNVENVENVEDYDLPSRGVHAEYLDTLLVLKDQIREYMAYADKHLSNGESETDLTVFSTVELHIFQTYYGGLRLSKDKTSWIYGNFDLVEQFCESTFDIKEWLIDQGSEFNNQTAFTLIGCLWQRVTGVTGGVVDGTEIPNKWGAYFKVPENTIQKANAKNKIMTRTTADKLITDDSGRVVGVHATRYDGTEVEVTATKGVVIATGGYGANIDMVIDTNEYWNSDDLTSAIKTTNRNLSVGEGITMATEVGAGTIGMGFTQLMPLGWVDNGNLAGGTGETVIYVGPAGTPNAGKRYIDESAERDVLAQAAFDFGTEDGVYIEIGNPDDFSPFNPTEDVEGRIYYCTPAEAGDITGIDATVLEQTIREYDAYVMGVSTELSGPTKAAYRGIIGSCEVDENGKYITDTYKLEKIRIRYLAPSTHHTMGGLVVDLERHVLDESGAIIPGLYAAGEVSGGIHAGNRLGANAVVEVLVSGRIAGETAAKEN